jgi:hypothetical protein
MSTLADQRLASLFDVFVSYSESDESWVLDQLLPRLREAEVRTIHRGAFSPGSSYVEELERAMRDCPWTVLVITPSYLGDTWAQYEEKLAAGAVRETGEWRVIPVVRGPCDLPARIRQVVPVQLSDDNDWLQWSRLVKRIRGPSVPDEPRQPGLKEAFGSLKTEPSARDMMVRFETGFRAAKEQIVVLANYKSLHDLLHNVQLSCYNPIFQEARRFPEDEVARETLGDYALTLFDYIDRIRLVTNRPTFETEDVSWVDDLAQAHDDLREALATSNPRQLQRAISALRRVLDLQPSQINSRMNQTAGALRLRDLVTYLRHICQRLSGMNVVPAELAAFTAQVDVVLALNDELMTIRSHHDRWQDLDCALRRIEDVLKLDVEELQNSWQYLKKITDPLCSNATDEWAKRFRESMHQLEAAIAQGVEEDVRQPFRSYRAQATIRFFRVDESMKDVCERLRNVGQPIEHALGMST